MIIQDVVVAAEDKHFCTTNGIRMARINIFLASKGIIFALV